MSIVQLMNRTFCVARASLHIIYYAPRHRLSSVSALCVSSSGGPSLIALPSTPRCHHCTITAHWSESALCRRRPRVPAPQSPPRPGDPGVIRDWWAISPGLQHRPVDGPQWRSADEVGRRQEASRAHCSCGRGPVANLTPRCPAGLRRSATFNVGRFRRLVRSSTGAGCMRLT